jgi:hypothetical protein
MRIIEKGLSEIRSRCQICGCVFEFDVNGLENLPPIWRYHYSLCPNCGSPNTVRVENIE